MCDDNKGYFVFLYNIDGEITTLAGSIQHLDQYEIWESKEEVVKLPKAFMLGSTFNGIVFYHAKGSRLLACIPIASRPLAL